LTIGRKSGSRAWSMRACQVLRPRRVAQALALSLLDILPSATQTASAPGISFLSRLNGRPARSPADASPTSSRMPAHGSGPMWCRAEWPESALSRRSFRPSRNAEDRPTRDRRRVVSVHSLCTFAQGGELTLCSSGGSHCRVRHRTRSPHRVALWSDQRHADDPAGQHDDAADHEACVKAGEQRRRGFDDAAHDKGREEPG
jgi:hypothetical protein